VKRAVVLCAFVSGCAAHTHSQVDVGAASPQGGVQVHIEGGRGLATLLGLSILAAGIYDAERNPFVAVSGNRPDAAPPLAPDRKISEQDCTQPLDYSLGNIRCK
jgi:hypothetical protein